METPTELEKYLRGQTVEGHKESEGAFSISKEKALAKLSEFQLPFGGAWTLKVVQAAVATGICRGIKVTLGRNHQSFTLAGVTKWTIDSVEAALLDPDSSGDRALDHLVAAMRSVGFSEKRGFWLALPEQHDALLWDGQTLSRSRPDQPVHDTVFVVTVKSKDDDGGYFGLSNLLGGTPRNAEASNVLSRLAYTCPVPLQLDGRRIDSLELNPTHGWGKTSQLLTLGFCDGDLPPLGIPRQTGQRISVGHRIYENLAKATESWREPPEIGDQCSLAYMVSAHLERVKSGKAYVWEERECFSHCNWVADGVIVQAEQVKGEASFCSVGWLVSADGLPTDLTSLYLKSSTEKDRRFHLSRSLLAEELKRLKELDFSSIAEIESQHAKTGGMVSLVLGAGLVFASPVHGILFLGFGALSYFSGGSAGKARQRSLQKGLKELRYAFCSL